VIVLPVEAVAEAVNVAEVVEQVITLEAEQLAVGFELFCVNVVQEDAVQPLPD
jgi:hypothetical protein